MNEGKEEKQEKAELKVKTDSLGGAKTIEEECSISIAESLIVIKNKLGRKWV